MYIQNLLARMRLKEKIRQLRNATVLYDGDYTMITDTKEIMDNIEKRLHPEQRIEVDLSNPPEVVITDKTDQESVLE